MHSKPKDWGKYLHWAEWHYNTSIHTATGYTPYHIVYGKPPPSLPQYIKGSSTLEAVDTMLTDSHRTEILENLRSKLLKAQTTMKLYADRRRIPHPFKEGDMALVKLCPFVQTFVAGHRSRKLSKHYYGPFKLKKVVGEVAFELELPPTSRIHPAFHVSN